MTVTAGDKTITDTYNATGTRANRTYGFTTPYTVALTYLAGANGSKTGMVTTYQNGSEDAYVYEYDANGNITSITRGALSATYAYDDMNQLVRANDGYANLTTTYIYDLSGNILERNEYDYTTGTLGTPTDTVAYTYDTTWCDQLASYDGQAITYDAIGNPLTSRGFTMTWQGKRLSTLSGNGTTASYTYNEQGVRTSKTVNSVVTNYSYNGSLLMAQMTGSGANQIKQLYSYDASGQLVSANYNGTEYYYLRNGQNDIVGLMDSTGATVVECTYDSWGKSLTVSGTLATTLGANNPFRYRGYYYDTETGLYYLQTRYYDATVCRFISADMYISTGQGIVGSNMYAYCLSNPLTLSDDRGTISDKNFNMAGNGNGSGKFSLKTKLETKKAKTKKSNNDVTPPKQDKKFIRLNNLSGTYSSKNENTSAILSLVALTATVTYSFFSAEESSIGIGVAGEIGSVGLSTPISVGLIVFGFAMCTSAVSYATDMASNIIIATNYASQGLPFTLTEVFPFVYCNRRLI